jgi:hypothetical protein
MAMFQRATAPADVDEAVHVLNRGRKLKLALAVAIIIGVALAALIFAQLSSSPSVPYGY